MKKVTLCGKDISIEFKTRTGEFGFDLSKKDMGIVGIDFDDKHLEVSGLGKYRNIEKFGVAGNDVMYEII